VRFAGTKSWRFGHDDLDVLRRALFVRDAAVLPVTASVDVPPRLSGDIPADSSVLAEADRAAAAAQWLQWWRRMLDLAVREVSVRKAEEPGDDITAEAPAPGALSPMTGCYPRRKSPGCQASGAHDLAA
jgi:hypothetical protein